MRHQTFGVPLTKEDTRAFKRLDKKDGIERIWPGMLYTCGLEFLAAPASHIQIFTGEGYIEFQKAFFTERTAQTEKAISTQYADASVAFTAAKGFLDDVIGRMQAFKSGDEFVINTELLAQMEELAAFLLRSHERSVRKSAETKADWQYRLISRVSKIKDSGQKAEATVLRLKDLPKELGKDSTFPKVVAQFSDALKGLRAKCADGAKSITLNFDEMSDVYAPLSSLRERMEFAGQVKSNFDEKTKNIKNPASEMSAFIREGNDYCYAMRNDARVIADKINPVLAELVDGPPEAVTSKLDDYDKLVLDLRRLRTSV